MLMREIVLWFCQIVLHFFTNGKCQFWSQNRARISQIVLWFWQLSNLRFWVTFNKGETNFINLILWWLRMNMKTIWHIKYLFIFYISSVSPFMFWCGTFFLNSLWIPQQSKTTPSLLCLYCLISSSHLLYWSMEHTYWSPCKLCNGYVDQSNKDS